MRGDHGLPSTAAIICLLMLGGFQPAHALCALPNQLTNGQTADATQVMANFAALANCLQTGAPAGSINALQFNGGGGSFGSVGPLTNGQIVIGSTGNAPLAATLSAGTGITVTNGPGNITISSAGASGNGYYELGPFAPPTAASFTFIDSPSSITPTVTDVTNAGLAYSVPVTNNTGAYPGVYRTVPTAVPWTLTLRAKYSIPMGTYPEFGIFVKDSAGKMLGGQLEGNNGTLTLIARHNTSSTQYDSNAYLVNISSPPEWLRMTDDGTNITLAVSWDSQNWLSFYQEGVSSYLNGNLQYVGVGGATGITNTSAWLAGSMTGALVTYWDINDDPASGRGRR